MNSPNPALVSQRAAQPLPRLALLLFCAAYVLPGVFGRDPWKNADATAFALMSAIAEGRTGWLMPSIAGLPTDGALLPYWLGAVAVKALGPLLGAPVAARVPFALLLVLVLVLTWYACYHLARTDAAKPLPFAFGGEANPVDYARAMADGTVLALMATLGLLQLGHETTPELGQLASAALLLYGLAASPFRKVRARLALLVAVPALAASGAPTIGLAMALVGLGICRRSSYEPARACVPWLAGAAVAGAALAVAIGAWGWRLGRFEGPAQILAIGRQLAWFLWPAWLLALWTLWRWRAHLLHRHIAVPLGLALVPTIGSILMGGADRALMLALPGLATLAAFALPTLKRSASAAIDWFSVFFFTICAIAIWVIYVAMHTGWPEKPAANVAKLAPGFEPSFSSLALGLAVLGSIAWLALVQWRTGRSRHPIWKSLVLPAGGVALCWLLLMTLWLPLLDYARSYRPLMQRIAQQIPADACVAAPSVPRSLLGAMEYLGRYSVDAVTPEAITPCPWLMRSETPRTASEAPPGWELVARIERPTDRNDITALFRRTPGAMR